MGDAVAVFVDYAPDLLRGLAETTRLTVIGTLCALIAAVGLRAAAASGWPFLRIVVRLYTEVILGLPILVLLYCLYFVAPGFGLRLSAQLAGITTLTLYYSPYMAEALRAAVAAIPPGQIEAGESIGMSALAISWRVVLPQAAVIALPALVGLLIGLAKDTAILSIVSVKELSFVTKQVVSLTFMPFQVWAGVALIYWVCLTTLDLSMRRVENRLARFRRPA